MKFSAQEVEILANAPDILRELADLYDRVLTEQTGTPEQRDVIVKRRDALRAEADRIEGELTQ